MEESFQIIIYIILGIIYFVFSILGEGKDKKKPAPKKPANKNLQAVLTQLKQNTATSTQSLDTSREASLQKLLREIKAERNTPKPTTQFDENRDEDFFQDSFAQQFEQGKDFDRSQHPNFEKIKIKSNLMEEKRTTTPRKTHPYQKLFKQKDTLKQAFILSEIFHKKYH